MKHVRYVVAAFTCMGVALTYAVSIHDVSQVVTAQVRAIHAPATESELSQIVKAAQGQIAIAGGRFSQGGHIWVPNGTVIDTTYLNKIIHLDIATKTITVQAGIRWRDIQAAIAPHGLAVAVMQSYNDFTVGGSLSVNVHGRDIAYGPMIETVLSIKVLCADGSIVTANRTENYDLFRAVIGGYGACGIITEATLALTDDVKIERKTERMTLKDYRNYYFREIYKNPNVVFHNANIYPNEFRDILCVTWYRTNRPLTITSPLMPTQSYYPKEMLAGQILQRIGITKKWRLSLEQKMMYTNEPVVMRNYEMGATVASLEPFTRFFSTNVLQEYFVPLDKLEDFVEALGLIVRAYGVNILNVSIRYVPQNDESLLSYATQESFSFVIYLNFMNTASGYAYAQEWTQRLINLVGNLGGTYYLPYQLFATKEQFEKIYPGRNALKQIKQQYDPAGKFSNSFIKKYLA